MPKPNGNKILYFLKRVARRRTVVESFFIDGNVINIVDETHIFNLFPSIRIMEGDGGWYSAIYKDNKHIKQPVYPEIQFFIENWNKIHMSSRYLILGSAGCAMPRFISMKYPDSKVLSIEKSIQMISIANSFFLNDIDTRNIELFHADAFEYLNDIQKYSNIKYDVCIVDLFNGSKMVDGIYDESFIRNLSFITGETSIVLFNFSGQSYKQGVFLCKLANKYFSHSYLCSAADSYVPILIKDVNVDMDKLCNLFSIIGEIDKIT